jgi:flagellar assembly protein FliH
LLPRPFVRDPDALADAEAASALEQAHARGRMEGEQRAAEEYERQLGAIRAETAAAIRRLGELREQMDREYQSLLRELALEAAARIARQRIAEDDPVAARALAEAVEALPPVEGIQARLHPDDVAIVERDLAELIERRRVELRADPALSRGGCVVESGAGTIDATLETAEREIRAAARGGEEAP